MKNPDSKEKIVLQKLVNKPSVSVIIYSRRIIYITTVQSNETPNCKTKKNRIQPIPKGRKTEVKKNLEDLLHPDLKLIILHIGAYDATADKAQNVFTNLILLKKDNEKKLTKSKDFISSLIKRTKPS